MAGQPAAVLGTGQTKYVAKRQDVSMLGLVREAIDRAVEDSGSTFDDIDAVVVGKAPDFFEGVMMPELFMADALGATGKPLIRVHTAGSVGGSTSAKTALVSVRKSIIPGPRARKRTASSVCPTFSSNRNGNRPNAAVAWPASGATWSTTVGAPSGSCAAERLRSAEAGHTRSASAEARVNVR